MRAMGVSAVEGRRRKAGTAVSTPCAPRRVGYGERRLLGQANRRVASAPQQRAAWATMVRRIGAEESRKIAELRATSFGAKDAAPGQVDAVAALLDEHIVLGDFACFVAEHSDEVVSFGIGMIHQRLPADHNPTGRWGYIQSMENHPDHRRRGYGGAIVAAFQAWFSDSGVPAATLVSTELGEPVYRSKGFIDEPFGRSLIWFASPQPRG